MKSTFLLIGAAVCAFAQGPVTPPVPPIFVPTPQWFDLKQYLQLTDAQYVKLLDNQAQYQRANNQSQQRIFQLQGEISAETSRERPDPVELGTRYAEIEMICRQFSNSATQLRDQNGSLLTDPQKTRLKALDDARKLAPIIAQAQSAFLLDQGFFGSTTVPTTVIRSGDFSSSISGALIGGISPSLPILPYGGCQARLPSPVFTPTPAIP